MIALWMGLIALLAALLALRPLIARPPQATPRRRALNVASYRSRLSEIDQERVAGTLAEDAAQSLRDEAALRLLDDAGTAAPAPEAPLPERAWGAAALGALLIAGLAGGGYWLGGRTEIAGWITQAQADPAAADRLAIDSMVRRLEERLQRESDDAQGWAMLGRSYFVQNRHAESAAAYERANRLVAATPQADWLADEAEVRAMLQQGDLQGLPRQLFERALAIDPAQPKALWYGGLAAAQGGDYERAIAHWRALRDGELPDAFRKVLDERLQELAQLTGAALPEPPPVAAAGPQLVLDVRLDPALVSALQPGDTLYVLARQPAGGGPPLAVQRLPAAALPARVTLSDADAMAPGFKLSSAQRWEIVARVSRSGTPQAQPGDLEGRITVDAAQAGAPLALQIDRRLP